jgi:AcrR family transcriptional regulator
MRAQIQACPTRPRPTERDRQRRAYILDAATRIFTAHGRLRVTMRAFATATGLSQTTIRRHIYDLDHLFALTLAKHLDTILAAIGAVPTSRPDLQARRRAEYLRITRGFLNVPTPIHFLWLRERFTLPEDELGPLEQTLHIIGGLLAGDDGQTALLLLDSPHLDQTQIETMLAAHTRAIEPEPAAQSTQTQAPPTSPAAPQHSQPAAKPAPRLNQPATITALARAAATQTPLPPLHGPGAATPFRPPRIGQPPPRAAPVQAA